LARLPHAPSVGLHDVPSESVATHIGLKDYDKLDERLAREYLTSYPPLLDLPFLSHLNRTVTLRVSVAGGSWKHHL
jgi:hypothetical protein